MIVDCDHIREILQMELLKVPIFLLDKTMGIFLPVIKDRTSINGFVLMIADHSLQRDIMCSMQKDCL
jgi:hypothetical protein